MPFFFDRIHLVTTLLPPAPSPPLAGLLQVPTPKGTTLYSVHAEYVVLHVVLMGLQAT